MMIVWTLVISLAAIIADAIIKQSAITKNNWLLVVGMLIYASQAILWWWVYQSAKFSTVAIVYSVFTILLSIVIGIAIFKETITAKEIIGIVLGIGSVILLARFGE